MARPVIRHIVLDNPPVNGLGWEVRRWLLDEVDAALGDAGVAGLVVRGAGRMFCGGADIRQFGTPKVAMQPLMRDVNGRLEAAHKPVVAALHGHALGGGLELAMACHARVATAGTRVGLPEVTLGIVPGGGGTQRLPRLIGVEAALDWIVTGRRFAAQEEQACGLLDAVVDGPDVAAAAEDLVHALLQLPAEGLRARAARNRPLSLPAADAPMFFADARARIAREHPGRQAPLAAAGCVEAAYAFDYEDALTHERETFLRLVDSKEAADARAAFAPR